MEQKIIQDFLLATQDTIYVLQEWSSRLEQWQSQEHIEPTDFAEACRQLREAGLWAWAADAGGHGIAALVAVLAQQFGVTPQVAPANFFAAEPPGGFGTGCQLSLQETNEVFQVEDGLELTEQVETALTPLGWTLDQDSQFVAEAFTTVNSEFNQGYAQCQLNISGKTAPGVQCGEWSGFSSCFYEQLPQQQLYSLQLTCAELPH